MGIGRGKTDFENIGFVTVNEEGRRTAAMLRTVLPSATHLSLGSGNRLSDLVTDVFGRCDGLVFCMALGIVNRVIAPHLTDKNHDPAIVAVDNARRYAVSALSGHEGGANALCYEVARATGAEPVVTTATESLKKVVIGIGCRKGIGAEKVESAVVGAVCELGISIDDVRVAASADLKRCEAGLIGGCDRVGIPVVYGMAGLILELLTPEELDEIVVRVVPGVTAASMAAALLGAPLMHDFCVVRSAIY